MPTRDLASYERFDSATTSRAECRLLSTASPPEPSSAATSGPRHRSDTSNPPDLSQGTAPRPAGGRPGHRPAKRSIRRLAARSAGAAIRRGGAGLLLALAVLLTGAPAHAQTVVFEATLTATPNSAKTSAILRWTAGSIGGSAITKYQYRQKVVGGWWGSWTNIANSASLTTYTVSGLNANNIYTFQMRAFNSTGTDLWSNEATILAPPRAPSGVTATRGVRQVALSWTAATGITKYQYRVSDGGGTSWDPDWTDIAGSGASTTSHMVSGLKDATPYTVEVRASSVYGPGPAASVEGRTLGPPEPPENLHATPAFEQVTLSWTMPSFGGGSAITTYQMRRKTGSGSFGNWTDIPGSGPRTTSCIVPDLTNGTTYTFELRAVSAVGPGEVAGPATVTPVAPPAAPLELTASPGEGAVTLRWKAPQPVADRASVTGYEVRLRVVAVGGVSFSNAAWGSWQPADNATRYLAAGLVVGREYESQVRATSAGGFGEASAGATATPGARPAGKPSAPRNLRVRTTDSSRADLRWVAPDNTGGSRFVGYRIEVCTVADCFEDTAWEVVVNNTRSAANAELTYVDEGIDGLRHRRYRVRAINTGFGAGDWSAPARLPRTEVTHFNVGWGNDHRTLVVDFNVAQPDGEDVYVLLHRVGDAQADHAVQHVALTQAALDGERVTLVFGGLQGDTRYEARLDFRDSFDSPRRLTARERSMPAGHRTSKGGPRPALSVAEATASTDALWSADMTVVDYQTGSIGAASAGLFSNVVGSANLQARSLWYDAPGRQLHLAFTTATIDPTDLILRMGDVALPFTYGGSSSFTWDDVDVAWTDGETVPVRVTRGDAVAVPPVNRAPTGQPTIAGTAQVGATLTASASGIADADGLTGATFAYQWRSDDGGGAAEIAGATGPSYTLVDADLGRTIKVRVTFTDDGGTAETLPSAATRAVAAVPLTARFTDMPAKHDGESVFTFKVQFSEGVASKRAVVRSAFRVSGGAVSGLVRQGGSAWWQIKIEPSGHGDISIALPAKVSCSAGGLCTADGRRLSKGPRATVQGPVEIAVADARVNENTNAALAFAVTLSRAASGTVTVDYATADGTATAGTDYTATSGTLRFTVGETSKTVSVTVLDDSHDEGEETLTLTLSNASGGRLTDGTATGTIENTDPLPRGLMARFGRAAALHVVEHVQERIEARREPGIQARFAGRAVGRKLARDLAVGFLSRLGSSTGAKGGYRAGAHGRVADSPVAGTGLIGAPRGSADGLVGRADPMGSMPGTGEGLNQHGHLGMDLGGGKLLTGSAFELNRETGRGGILSFWSRGAQSRFAGREGKLSLGGRVRTTMLGADYAKGPLVTGLSLSHSRGLGGYSGVDAGEVTSSVTGLYPWLGYKVTDRITLWGVTGYGKGALTLTPGAGTALKSGLWMAMAAGGLRGELSDSVVAGFGLAFKADALWVDTGIEGVDGPEGRLAATAAAVTRYRTALEASRGYSFRRGLSLQPRLEVGLRRDAGDAETGSGMDIAGGLIVSEPSMGLSADVRVRMLLVHQAEGFRDRGVSMSFSYNPTPSTPLGFMAKVTPSWGGQAKSGARALWGRKTMAGLTNGSVASGSRLDADVGYGLPVGSRFVGTPRFGIGASEIGGRDYRLGYGLTVLQRDAMSFELGIDAARRQSLGQGGAEHGVQASPLAGRVY